MSLRCVPFALARERERVKWVCAIKSKKHIFIMEKQPHQESRDEQVDKLMEPKKHKAENAEYVATVFENEMQLFDKFLDAKIIKEEIKLLNERFYPQDSHKVAEKKWYSKFTYPPYTPDGGKYTPEYLSFKKEVDDQNKKYYKLLQKEIIGKTDRIKAKETFEHEFFEGIDAISVASDRGVILFYEFDGIHYQHYYETYETNYIESLGVDLNDYNWERYDNFKSDLFKRADKIVDLLEFLQDRDAFVKAVGIDAVSCTEREGGKTIYEKSNGVSSEERKIRFLKTLHEFRKKPEELVEEEAKIKAKKQAERRLAEKKRKKIAKDNLQKFDPSI
jgi:hypothetical protein